MSTQVTIIGGGSYQWAPELMADLFGTPALAGMHLVLEDVDPAPLPKMEALAHKVNEALGAKATIASTTDQKAALEGADFVIVCISTGGFRSMAVDLDVPAAHGITQTVGDSVGPGGINRALRNIPVLVGIAKDMEEMCPDAWLFNITNPMTTLTRSVCRETGIKAVGLCHEVGNFTMDLAIALGKPWDAITPSVTGVNHFPVLTALDVDGDNGFDIIRDLVEEVGGLASLAPYPGPPRSRGLLQAALRPAPCAQADHAGSLGHLPGRRGPAHCRVRVVCAHPRVRVGRRLQHRAEPDHGAGKAPGRIRGRRRRLAGRHQGPADLAVG